MFYHPILLQPQNQMQLLVPWLASTRGIKKVKKEDIVKCNVIKVCDHIQSFVVSDSLNPTKRFSLRLSTRLINGLCMIWKEQVIYLQNDIDRILLDRKKAVERLLIELRTDYSLNDDASPRTPKPTTKKTRKTKPQQQDTPESLVERIGPIIGTSEPEFDMGPLILPDFVPDTQEMLDARAAKITLTEEPGRPEPELRLSDDFGPMEDPSINLADVQISTNIPEEPRVGKETTVSQSLEVPEQNVPQIPVEEIQEPVQVVPEIVAIPSEEEPPSQKTKRRNDLSKLEVVQVEPKAPKKKNRKSIAASLLLNKKKRRFVPINQPMQKYVDEPEFVILAKSLPSFKPLKKFWPESEEGPYCTIGDVRPPRETGSTRYSGATDKSLGTSNKTAETPDATASGSVPLMHQDTPSSEVPITPSKRTHVRDEAVQEVLDVANGDMGPPAIPERKRKKVVSVEEVQANELPSKEGDGDGPEDPGDLEGKVTSRSAKEEASVDVEWSREIMKVIYQYDLIGLVDICKNIGKRVTKENIAMIFSTLLSLAKLECVVLRSAEDSTLLSSAGIGPREYQF